jgi:hypothetical protein
MDHDDMNSGFMFSFTICCTIYNCYFALEIYTHCLYLRSLDGVQFFALPLVLGEGLVPLLVANTFYAVALSWYWYVTHLGYRTLPFLAQTEVFLFPIAAIVLVYVLMIVGHFFGFGWNAARVMARFYFM